MRVSFIPHFSRLQEDIKKLHNTITDYLVGFLWIMVMWTTFLWTSSSPLVASCIHRNGCRSSSAGDFRRRLPLDMIIGPWRCPITQTNRNWSAIRIYALRTALNVTLAFAGALPRIVSSGFHGRIR